MKHKCEWETTGPSTRCLICGKQKIKPFVDKDANKEYMRQYHLDNPRKRVNA